MRVELAKQLADEAIVFAVEPMRDKGAQRSRAVASRDSREDDPIRALRALVEDCCNRLEDLGWEDVRKVLEHLSHVAPGPRRAALQARLHDAGYLIGAPLMLPSSWRAALEEPPEAVAGCHRMFVAGHVDLADVRGLARDKQSEELTSQPLDLLHLLAWNLAGLGVG